MTDSIHFYHPFITILWLCCNNPRSYGFYHQVAKSQNLRRLILSVQQRYWTLLSLTLAFPLLSELSRSMVKVTAAEDYIIWTLFCSIQDTYQEQSRKLLDKIIIKVL